MSEKILPNQDIRKLMEEYRIQQAVAGKAIGYKHTWFQESILNRTTPEARRNALLSMSVVLCDRIKKEQALRDQLNKLIKSDDKTIVKPIKLGGESDVQR